MEQPFDGIDEIYNQKLGACLNFFASRLHLYYSSSRLTLLLTLLDIPPDRLPSIAGFQSDIIPLPSKLKRMDSDALSFFSASHLLGVDRKIFQDFLDSAHPLALDGQRHAIAASACLKIIFICDQAPHSWRILRVDQRPQRYRTDPKPKTLWHRSVRHWHQRTSLSNPALHKILDLWEFQQKIRSQRFRSRHLKFLLEKSAYSANLLDFARLRVFRFGYLQQNHPKYMKTVIFALATYIHRVTGRTAEVRACESIWGRQRWFSEN